MRFGLAALLALAATFGRPAWAQPEQHFELSPPTPSLPASGSLAGEQIEQEALIRSHQLQLHQRFAYAALGAMALTTAWGLATRYLPPAWNPPAMLPIHQSLGGITSGLYLTAATLAVTAPKGYEIEEPTAWDSVTLHRGLAWIHGTALVATAAYGILTAVGNSDPSIHGLLGGTTLGLMAVSAGVIAFDF